MSDTPRTDAQVEYDDRSIPLANFARELERENAALKERLTSANDALRFWHGLDLIDWKGKAEKAEAERDALHDAIVAATKGQPCPTPAQWAQIQSLFDAAKEKP
jgi:hypothetical protein